MADWPQVEELKARLNVESTDWDAHLTRILAAAIAQTKQSVGDWVEGLSTPTEALAQSALERAVSYGSTGEEAIPRKAKQLLATERRRWPVA